MRLLLSIMATAVIVLPSAAAPAAAGARTAAFAALSADCAGTGASDFDGDGLDDVAVGDPFADPGGQNGAGAVHVLLGRGEGGRVVTAPEPRAADGFGWSVRLAKVDADGCADLIVGAPYEEVDGLRNAGAVYVLYGGPEGRTLRLVAPKAEADAHFGWSLASDGKLLAVGAPHEDADGITDSGAVYLFDTATTGPGWRITQETKGVAGNSEIGDMFGWSLALGRLGGNADEPDLAVGAPYENDDGAGRQAGDSEGRLDAGALTVIFDVRRAKNEYRTRKWELRDIVDAGAGDRFGYAVAYGEQGGNGYLAVSAPLGDGGGVKDSGLVQLFLASGNLEITAAATFHQASEGAAGEGYGFSLAFSATDDVRLAVGVPFDGPDRRGGVRLLTMGAEGTGRLIAQSRADDHFGWSVGFSGNRLVVGAPDLGGRGGVVLLGRNDTEGVTLSPGTGKIPALEDAASTDFGSAVG